MTKSTETLRKQARDLYTLHGLTLRAISIKIMISERTLGTWKKQDAEKGQNWDEIRAIISGAEGGLAEELDHLATVVARKIREDLEKPNGQVDDRVYHLEKLLKSWHLARKKDSMPPPPGKDTRSPAQRKKDAAKKLDEVFGI